MNELKKEPVYCPRSPGRTKAGGLKHYRVEEPNFIRKEVNIPLQEIDRNVVAYTIRRYIESKTFGPTEILFYMRGGTLSEEERYNCDYLEKFPAEYQRVNGVLQQMEAEEIIERKQERPKQNPLSRFIDLHDHEESWIRKQENEPIFTVKALTGQARINRMTEIYQSGLVEPQKVKA